MLRLLLTAALLGGLTSLAAADDKKDEKRSGSVTGVVTAKDKAWIEVKAAGEEKGRRYVPHWRGGAPKDGGGPDKKLVEALGKIPVGSQVRLEWEFDERPRVVKLELLKAPDNAKEGEKDALRGGTVTGKITDKGDRFIEVKADGEEKARKYVPHWRGSNPGAGGGFDKEMVAKIKEAPLHSRVRVEWVFDERPRVEKIEVLKKPDEKKPADKGSEKRSGRSIRTCR